MRGPDGTFQREIFSWTQENWDAGYLDNKGYFRIYRPDYPKIYKVSNKGNILSTWGHNGKKYLKVSPGRDGYILVTLTNGVKRRAFGVHRLVAMASCMR